MKTSIDTPLWRLVHAHRAKTAEPSGALRPLGDVLAEFELHATYLYAVLRGDKPASQRFVAKLAEVTGVSPKTVQKAANMTRAVRR